VLKGLGAHTQRLMPFPPGAVEKIRSRVGDGTLPREAKVKMYAGPGSGKPCDGCDGDISAAQVEI
jgi:hypothetical protein